MSEYTYEIIPSIASANQLFLAEEIEKAKGYQRLHIDLEDGNFVPNISFGMKTIRAIGGFAPQILDVHILARHPQQYIETLKECKIKDIAVHVEAAVYPFIVINKIQNLGMRGGLALNYTTPTEVLNPFIHEIDYVVLMSSEPDGAGEKFRPGIFKKIADLRKILPDSREIWVDGGIERAHLPELVESGADKLVMGRGIFGT